ncbi:MAG: DUF484 family protein [Gammaproteobacteria bacterium]|nr:DUF484 family protein [Gammaproteobacteria bacterium]
MSKQSGDSDSEKAVSEISEEEILSYLEKHPDLLMRHPDLLERLQIPHNTGKGMVSLIERQVEVLRDKNRQQEEQLFVLISNAQQNEEITEKLHRYSLQLSSASGVKELLQNAVAELQQLFDLAAVSIHIKPEYQGTGLQTSTLTEKTFAALFDTLGKDTSSCHDALDDALLTALFGNNASAVKSCALLALDTPHRVGLIALGASERERFSPQMGTLILSRLGEQFSTALKRNHDF